MESVGLFGGSFNPIHHGHLIAARAVSEGVGLARVVFLPSRQPPHKHEDDLLDGAHRGEMVKLAIADEPRFSFSDYDLTRQGPSFTIDTVRHFRAELGSEVELCWIIGADSLRELPTWRSVTELIEECRIITAARPGWKTDVWDDLRHTFTDKQVERLRSGVVETPLIDISATDIRGRISSGLSVRYLMPEAVISYVRENNLYT